MSEASSERPMNGVERPRLGPYEAGDGGGEVSSGSLETLFRDVERDTRAMDRSLIGWFRSRSTLARLALVVAVCVAVVGPVALFLPRPDLAVYPQLRFAWTVGALVALTVWLAARATRPLHRPPMPPVRRVAAPLAALLTLALVALLPMAHGSHPASVPPTGASLWERHFVCVFDGVIFAIPILVVGRILDRGGHETLWAAAALAGVVANLVLFVACPLTPPSHLFLGHVTVALVVLAGAWAWRRASESLARGGSRGGT